MRQHGVQRGHGIGRTDVFRVVLPGIARAGSGTVQFRDNLRKLIFVARHSFSMTAIRSRSDNPSPVLRVTAGSRLDESSVEWPHFQGFHMALLRRD